MRLRGPVLAVLLASAVATPALAQGTAISLRAGSFGPSLGVITSLGGKLNLRLDVPYLQYSRNDVVAGDEFDLSVDSKARLLSVAGLLELHPFGNALRLSAGGILNKSHGELVLRSAEPYTVGGTTYSVEEIGQLNGRIEPGYSVAPYVGLGLGNAVGPNKRIGVSFDVGAMFMGKPKYTMTGTGMIAPTADQASVIQENLEWATIWPGVSLGLTIKLF